MSGENRESRSKDGRRRPETGEQKTENTTGINMIIQNAKELEVYQVAYRLSMRIFEISKRFPAEERWALTGQIRRSSRSVCLNLREAGSAP